MEATPSESPKDVGGSGANGGSGENSKTQMIALYYCYTPRPLPSVADHIKFQRGLCHRLGLGGRIRVSSEGINGVLSGPVSALRPYERSLREELLGACRESADGGGGGGLELDVKYCHLRPDVAPEAQMFENLSVKETREVVRLYEPGPKEQRAMSRRRRRRGARNGEAPREELDWADFRDGGTDAGSGAAPPPPHPENGIRLDGYDPAPHLSPEDWNMALISFASGGDGEGGAGALEPDAERDGPIPGEGEGEEAVLVDARNVYESRVGLFSVPGVPTILTNTRKYSSLPDVLEGRMDDLAGRHVFMYCTGGVRCERASVFLRGLAESDRWRGPKPKGIYQLRGGIQRYLERFGHMEGSDVWQQEVHIAEDAASSDINDKNKCPSSDATLGYSSEVAPRIDLGGPGPCLYRGKNFVFDPRRTDPVVGPGPPVGRCHLCSTPWDDYDNGHAPCDNKEARCCHCRILVLVCSKCREAVRAWGENVDNSKNDSGNNETTKPDLFCGPGGERCVNEGNSADAVEIVPG